MAKRRSASDSLKGKRETEEWKSKIIDPPAVCEPMTKTERERWDGYIQCRTEWRMADLFTLRDGSSQIGRCRARPAGSVGGHDGRPR